MNLQEKYQSVEGLIKQTVKNFQLSKGGNFHELLSEGNLGFMEAVDTHDSSKGEFTSWVRHCVQSKLMLSLRKKKFELHTTSLEDAPEIVQDRPGSTIYGLMDFLSSLGNDARTVVNLILQESECLVMRSGDKRKRLVGHRILTEYRIIPRQSRTRIRDRLLGIGWASHRVVRSFDEIKRVLQS